MGNLRPSNSEICFSLLGLWNRIDLSFEIACFGYFLNPSSYHLGSSRKPCNEYAVMYGNSRD